MALSPTLVSVRLLSESMRRKAEPTLNSAREFLSVQTRSEVVSGRFKLAATQSLTPPGCSDTSPETYWMRATRDGGSLTGFPGLAGPPVSFGIFVGRPEFSPSCANRADVLKANNNSATRNHPNCRCDFIFMLLRCTAFGKTARRPMSMQPFQLPLL